ncbi:MAG: hypothetical protein KVP17_004630 [Porospora cf. gigantea B]|uniref:uncharacterized protein n=1 Tax=Porospora cf. gigantea B TaxID=2853592 RepID=UPI0035719DD8|nr:MAG: hypothetical protein KVP17_004630 [Porospora cf. gigantea B]
MEPTAPHIKATIPETIDRIVMEWASWKKPVTRVFLKRKKYPNNHKVTPADRPLNTEMLT